MDFFTVKKNVVQKDFPFGKCLNFDTSLNPEIGLLLVVIDTSFQHKNIVTYIHLFIGVSRIAF